MNELGLGVEQALPWFNSTTETSHVLVEVPQEYAENWASVLALPIRRCYLTDSLINSRTSAGYNQSDIIAAALPDPGAVMAGDFGEILSYIYHCTTVYPIIPIGPKKWRLKEARTKAAPYSDVVTLVLPDWPDSGTSDAILCSEVKTKSTKSNWSPIEAAIAGCNKDRKSRLLETLLWLKERTTLQDIGELEVAHIDRFLKAIDHPPADSKFHAIVIICTSLVATELEHVPSDSPTDYTLVVITVPNCTKYITEYFRKY